MSKPLFVALALSCLSGIALAQTTPQERLVRSRAVEAVIWGMPAVNYDLMLQEMLTKTPGKVNQVDLLGQAARLAQPDADAQSRHALFHDVLQHEGRGPIVIEIPPADADGSLNANIVNVWQTAARGCRPARRGQGRGRQVPDAAAGLHRIRCRKAMIALQPDTCGGYALFRSNLESHGDADVAKSVAYGKRVKIYPLSQASNPPATVFTDVKDVVFDSTIRYDASFFDNLNRIVQSEPWLDRDRAMIDQLRIAGHREGQALRAGCTRRRQALADGDRAKRMRGSRRNTTRPAAILRRHALDVPGACLRLIKAAVEDFDDRRLSGRRARARLHYAFIGIKHLGAGQFYLINIKDKDGEAYDGGKTYRLHVPPNVPVEQYWSVTAYDRETHALIKTSIAPAAPRTPPSVQKNADGSVDIYFGPKAPAGKETNWIPTDPASQVRIDVPSLRADEGALRQDVGVAGRGEGRGAVNQTCQFGKHTMTINADPDCRNLLLAGTTLAIASVLAGGATSVASAETSSLNPQPLPPSPEWARALPPGPDTSVKITEAYAAMMARDAYFWAWPMVNIYNRRLNFKDVPEPMMVGPVPVGPAQSGRDAHRLHRARASASSPVRTRTWSMAQVRSRSMFRRWWSRCRTSATASGSTRSVDLRTDGFVQLGKMYGTKPGFYLLVGPDWQRRRPQGHHQSLSLADQHRLRRAARVSGRHAGGQEGHPDACSVDHDVPAGASTMDG